MAVAADGVACTYLLDLLYGLDLVIELLSVDGTYLALLEAYLEQFGTLFCRMLQVSTFGQSLLRIEYLAPADAGAPQTDVVAVLELGEVGKVAVLVEVIHLFLTGQVAVAGQRNDFHARTHHEERHVEAYLVVACAG